MKPSHQQGRDNGVRWGVIRSDISTFVRRVPALFRNDIPAIVLVVANVVPLINLAAKGEPIGSLLVIYWLQMWIIGFWTAIKLIVIARWAALAYVPMFFIMYLSIVNIFGFIAGGLLDDQMRGTAWVQNFSLWNYRVPALMFFAAHGLSFYMNFLGRREDETTSWEQQMGRPFLRAMPMWIAAIIGGVIGGFFNTAAIAAFFVMPVKTVIDLMSHFAEHDSIRIPDDPDQPIVVGK
jgi:hypothetical protein